MPFWSPFRRETLPSKKQPPKQHPLQQSEPPPLIPSWRRRPFTRLRWLRQRIRAERCDYDQDQSLKIEPATSIDEPSLGLEERPPFFDAPWTYLFWKQLANFRTFPRSRSMREIIALKGLEVKDLYNRHRPPRRGASRYSSSVLEDQNLTLSDAIERAVAHLFWAAGWRVDWLLYRTFEWAVKSLLWKTAQWIRRIFVFWAYGTMAWTVECYAVPPIPGSALALRFDGGAGEADQQLGPVIEELERAQKVIDHAIVYKGLGFDSVKCSVGDLARLSDSMRKVSWRMSLIYASIVKRKLLKQLGSILGNGWSWKSKNSSFI
ncbi:hypothetical protein PG994_011909 [Apiospora phragmitis]|uniref:Uncharacterized protein n=1 Tax=Apiospora phragmitis TaxID=2905665 RepID=A0ABR1TWU2_9PEZI